MSISSRTPEGTPHRCPVCRQETAIESSTHGDACCPDCGTLLWWFRDKAPNHEVLLSTSFESLEIDSLAMAELVMQLEEHFDIDVPPGDAEHILTVEDAIRYIRQYRADT
ncbi:phosphopantetheine-binding protein [Pirellula staleyi DSM 6068]|uniref:Phosphopantetheine-binding protein n=1 Tax=Pirellula staleyi (strain ATCC 27377 / DSM 6068 / ICPB 4128) TaxID=530564 RepID=D2R2F3_PIRSD|nr:acyl carrier protein [Pirellula staleyi]ADB15062.1 phosphopantetheine-binding protein [Pirellula staleyi DSM 6068]